MYDQNIPRDFVSDYRSSMLVQSVSAPDAEELGAGDMAEAGGTVFVVGSALVLGCAIRRTIRSAACERQLAAFNRLPRSLQMAVLALVVAGVVIGGGKPEANSPFFFLDMSQLPEGVSVEEVQGVSFCADDIALGKVLSGVSIDGVFDLSAPTNAVVHQPWLLRGAAEDGFWSGLQPPFPFGTNVYDAVYVSSSGTLSFNRPKSSPTARPMPDGSSIAFLAPLQTVLGIPPQARWNSITNYELQITNSLFWADTTDSGSARLTWQNALLNRATNAPVSFQAELFPDGDFIYRYDFSSLNPEPWPPISGVVVGLQDGGGNGRTALIATDAHACSATNHLCALLYSLDGTNVLSTPLCAVVANAPKLSLRWTDIAGLDPADPDGDGDGLSDALEVLVLHTDPRNPDTDGDGLADADEPTTGSDPLNPDADGDGLPDGTDLDPLVSASTRLALYPDACKSNAFSGTIHAGEAVYVEGLVESPSVGAEKIVWQYVDDDHRTHQITNVFTVLSQRIFGDLDFDGDVDADDKSAQASLSREHGWIMLPISGLTRKMLLRTDVDLPGLHVLSLSGDNAFRIYASNSTNGPPLLVGGQSITNGVNAVSFLSGSDTAIYVEAFTNGISTLTYSFLGAGDAAGIVCRASLKMTAIGIGFVSMWETANPANRIFNATPKDDPPAIASNKLYVVERLSDSQYAISLQTHIWPTALTENMRIGIFDGETKTVESSVSADGLAQLVFDHPASKSDEITDFALFAGYDTNGNGTLDASETVIPMQVENPATGMAIGPVIVRGTSETRHGTAWTQINGIVNGAWTAPGWATSLMIPHAKALLRIFFQGDTEDLLDFAPTGTNTVSLNAFAAVSGFSEWLTHNAGAPFDLAGTAPVKEYIWDDTRSMGELAMTSADMKQAVMSFYATNIATVALSSLVPGQSAWFPASVQGVDVPHISESPGWVPGATLELDSLLPNTIDDLNGTFGRIRIVSHKARFRVRMETVFGEDVLVVEETQTWGDLQDLYDFNHDVPGAAQDAAILQLGCGNGSQGAARANGIIYRTKVLFNKTYQGLP